MARQARQKKTSDGRDNAVSDGVHGFLRGHVAVEPLSGFKPNSWNPNRMTPTMMKAMVAGLVNDGWLVSQALLVWGTDEQGVAKNVIIDGEHRYRAALETGLTEGPVVRLDGITEAQAKALTVKMNQKRGDFDDELLAELLRGIQFDESILNKDADMAVMFGFEQEELAKLLAEPEEPLSIAPPPKPSADVPAPNAGQAGGSTSFPIGAGSGLPQSKIRMQQLFFDDAAHAEFTQLVRELSAAYGTKNVTDTTLAAVRAAAKLIGKSAALGRAMFNIQLRAKVAPEDVRALIGTHARPADFPLVSTHGDITAFKPNGQRLLTVVRNAVSEEAAAKAYPFLHEIRKVKTNNRGAYSGNFPGTSTTRKYDITASGVSKTSRALPVRSAIIGAFDRYPRIPFCRQTVLTATNPAAWQECFPLIQEVARVFEKHVPDRYAKQETVAKATHPAYVVPNTPYTTLTVNNCVAGAYHTDAGDYGPGFGCLLVLRRGHYEGCVLGFPAYGVAADLGDRDVILFDSHEVHGNTPFVNAVGEEGKDWERISIVFYFREKMIECLSPPEEMERAKALRGSLDLTTVDDAVLSEEVGE